MREVVRQFAENMEKVLEENDNKGGWDECDIVTLYKCLKDEVGELEELVGSKLIDQIDQHASVQNYIEAIQKEITDVANYCMMLHSKFDCKVFV